MREIIVLIALALTLFCDHLVAGGDPDGDVGFVLLKDRAVLPGVVTEEPGQILIRQGGSEIRVARDRVACWASSIAGLHRYLVDTREGSNLRSHLAIARWCLQNEYPAGSVAELVAARRLDPDNLEAASLEKELREWQAARDNAKNTGIGRVAKVASGTGGFSTKPDFRREQNPAVRSEPKLEQDSAMGETETDFASDAESVDGSLVEQHLATFAKEIQPILLNRCGLGVCHGSPGERAFTIELPHKSLGRPSAEMSRRNLEATLRWIDRGHSAASPLLVRALQPHGGLSQPPLEPQNRVAAELLRRWVASMGRQRDSVHSGNSVAMQGAGANASVQAPDSTSRPTRLPEVEDPFDPEVFNRRFHPDRRN